MYLIWATRWGNKEKHSYPIAIMENLERSKEVALEHYRYRGDKYSCYVFEVELDFYDEECKNWKEVYAVKSSQEEKYHSHKAVERFRSGDLSCDDCMIKLLRDFKIRNY